MARTARRRANELTADWPEAESDVPSGESARQFALRLREVIGERSLRSVARDAGVDHKTLSGILDGQTWADLETISKLEYSLGEMLWMYVLPAAPAEGVCYRARTGAGWLAPGQDLQK
ncbi:hypothetical protein AAEP80_00480 [Curtobacterium sp. L3-7]|uniref:hypothetical protein n=1 Tax=Curtobacterium sp. L3-7 TaxID=3138787 RepID=UPI003B52508A